VLHIYIYDISTLRVKDITEFPPMPFPNYLIFSRLPLFGVGGGGGGGGEGNEVLKLM